MVNEESKQETAEKVEEKKEIAEQLKKEEVKAEIKEKDKKQEKPKKTEAVVNGTSLPISTKHSMAICDAIRGKKIEQAIYFLEEVIKYKKAVPMKGEIPHRKGNIMSGRYPINAAKQFIKLLKQLSANATTNEIDLENAELVECKPNKASRPYKRFGSMKFKRTHVTLRLKVKQEKKK